MEEDEEIESEEFRFQTVGEQLKAGRNARNMSLADVAAQTRIPMRHLEAIEGSDFAALPGSTYSVGFAKAYARAVGLDQSKISSDLRTELSAGGHGGFASSAVPDYEPADSSRVPPRWLAWLAAFLAIFGVAGYIIWRNATLAPDTGAEVVAEAGKSEAAAENGAAAPASKSSPANGQVVLKATDTVWLKIYDGSNKRLYEAEMKVGESYTVPTDANNPMIITGRPDAIAVTVGGQPVPALGEPQKTIKNVGVSAAALLARKPEEATAPAAQAADAVPAPQ